MKYFQTFHYPSNETVGLKITFEDLSHIEIQLTYEELRSLLDCIEIHSWPVVMLKPQSEGETNGTL